MALMSILWGNFCPVVLHWRIKMIDFEKELEKFQPSMEVKEAEDVIKNKDLTDMIDILREMIKEGRA